MTNDEPIIGSANEKDDRSQLMTKRQVQPEDMVSAFRFSIDASSCHSFIVIRHFLSGPSLPQKPQVSQRAFLDTFEFLDHDAFFG